MKIYCALRVGRGLRSAFSPVWSKDEQARRDGRGAEFGPGFSEDREGWFGIYEDMSRECVWIPCPDHSRYPPINCSIALGAKASDGAAGPVIRARSICDSQHRRATVKRSAALSNNPRWNRTEQQRKCWDEIAKPLNSLLQLLSVCVLFFFFFFLSPSSCDNAPFSSLYGQQDAPFNVEGIYGITR